MANLESATSGVREVFARYTEAMVSGDPVLWTSIWDEKAVQMPPDAPAIFGKKAIADRISASFQSWRWEFAINTEEVMIAGELALARGTFVSSMTPRDGGDREFGDGKFLTVFKRQEDGTWRIYRDCYNFNTPRGR